MMKTVVLLVLVALFAASAEAQRMSLKQFVAKGKFSALTRLLKRADLYDGLDDITRSTFFLPTDFAVLKTARHFCPSAKGTNGALDCLIGELRKIGSVKKQLQFVLLYHVVPGLFPIRRVRKTKLFTTAAEAKFFRIGLTLFDQLNGAPNPKIIRAQSNKRVKQGWVHTINHMLLPYPNGPTDPPCNNVESPVVTAKGDFILIRKLIRLVGKCKKLQDAILACSTKNVCFKDNAQKVLATVKRSDGKMITIKLGKAISTLVKCPKVSTVAMTMC